jgi:hypothetical protein
MLASLDGLPNDVEVSGVLFCFELPCSFGIAVRYRSGKHVRGRWWTGSS